MSVSLDLSGKVALVSGGSRGIGAACVRMFAEAGAQVGFSYQKAADRAEKLVQDCGKERCHAVQSDLAIVASTNALAPPTLSRSD